MFRVPVKITTKISGGIPSAESDCSAIESKGEKA